MKLVRLASFLTTPGHHFEVADAAGKGIGDGLEHVGGDGLVVGDLALDGLAALVVQALDFAALQGRGQVIHQEIQQGLTADVQQPGGDHHREDALFR